jgi:ubiquinone/menaquinone biosynthesis C-methylase UbiE
MSRPYSDTYFSTERRYAERYGTLSRFPKFASDIYFRVANAQLQRCADDFDTYLEQKDGRILELGFGQGTFMHHATKNGHRITGLDMNGTEIRKAKMEGLDARRGDVSKRLPFKDGEFDMVYSSQVIEHIAEPCTMMKEMHRVLKPGGKLVIRTNDFQRCMGEFYGDYTHCHPYTKASLYRICADNDFEIKRMLHGCSNPSFLMRRIGNIMLLTGATTSIYKAISRLISYELCIVAKKPKQDTFKLSTKEGQAKVKEWLS